MPPATIRPSESRSARSGDREAAVNRRTRSPWPAPPPRTGRRSPPGSGRPPRGRERARPVRVLAYADLREAVSFVLDRRYTSLTGPEPSEVAARVEAASFGKPGRRADLAVHHDALAGAGPRRLGNRDGREERHRVRMGRRPIDGVARSDLDDAPKVHHGDPIAHVAHDGEIVGDEEEPHARLTLEIAEEVDDLGLDGDVEGGDRLVEDEHPGPEGHRAGDPDPLPLPARELVGVAVEVVLLEPHLVDDLDHPRAPRPPPGGRAPAWARPRARSPSSSDRGSRRDPGTPSARRGAGAASRASRGR